MAPPEEEALGALDTGISRLDMGAGAALGALGLGMSKLTWRLGVGTVSLEAFTAMPFPWRLAGGS